MTGGYKLPSQDEIDKRMTGGYKLPSQDEIDKRLTGGYKLPSQPEIDKRLTGGYKLPPQDEIDKRLTGGYKFDPAKAEVSPSTRRYNEAKQAVAETQLDELDRPSGKLFIIVKADNVGATHVFGDFGSVPQDVMAKVSKRGTRDKSGVKTKLKIDFLFDDFRSTVQQLRMIFRDVDFVGAETAEFIIHSSALKSDQGEDVKQLRDYIQSGDDRRMKIYQKPEEDDDEEGEPTGGNLPRAKKPQTQMGGKSTEQPGMTTYQFKDPIFARRLRGMNLGSNIKGNSITVDQKQKAKLLSILGNKFDDIFTSQERFKEDNSYMESLAQQLAEKIPKNAPVSNYIDDFAKAAKTPDAKGHHQFKNKSPEKVRQMAVAASYAAKNPSKKKK